MDEWHLSIFYHHQHVIHEIMAPAADEGDAYALEDSTGEYLTEDGDRLALE